MISRSKLFLSIFIFLLFAAGGIILPKLNYEIGGTFGVVLLYVGIPLLFIVTLYKNKKTTEKIDFKNIITLLALGITILVILVWIVTRLLTP